MRLKQNLHSPYQKSLMEQGNQYLDIEQKILRTTIHISKKDGDISIT